MTANDRVTGWVRPTAQAGQDRVVLKVGPLFIELTAHRARTLADALHDSAEEVEAHR